MGSTSMLPLPQMRVPTLSVMPLSPACISEYAMVTLGLEKGSRYIWVESPLSQITLLAILKVEWKVVPK